MRWVGGAAVNNEFEILLRVHFYTRVKKKRIWDFFITNVRIHLPPIIARIMMRILEKISHS